MEILDLCDEQGNPTGKTVEREIAHRDGLLHRTAHVWIARERDGKTQILLQKRSQNKESFPGLYDTSSAGHIPAGVDFVPSALRELREELGITARPEELAYAGSFRIRYEKLFHGALFRDNEFTRVYVYREPVDERSLQLQESEVEAVRWFDLEEVREEIRHSRDRFCVPAEGLDVLIRFLEKEGARMKLNYCPVCGEKLRLRQHPVDGAVAWCEACADWRYPLFSTAVSVTILNPERTKLLLIRQYGEPGFVFAAGYVDKGETAEDAVRREVREELGMTAEGLRFHKSRWYAPSETLMLHYSCTVPEREARLNEEVDAWEWVPVEDARAALAPGLAAELYEDYLRT